MVDEEAMKAELERKRQEYIQTYVSPWERAMKGDQTLTATMRACMPGPYIHKDLPLFKSFNRYTPHTHTHSAPHTDSHFQTHTHTHTHSSVLASLSSIVSSVVVASG